MAITDIGYEAETTIPDMGVMSRDNAQRLLDLLEPYKSMSPTFEELAFIISSALELPTETGMEKGIILAPRHLGAVVTFHSLDTRDQNPFTQYGIREVTLPPQ